MHPTLELLLYSLAYIFCLVFGWRLWKTYKAYADFPTPCLDAKWMLKIGTGRYPEERPFGSYVLNFVFAMAKHFEKEGLFFAWCFRPVLLVFGEEYVKVLMNHPSAVDRPFNYGILTDAVGKGILTHHGGIWEKSRKRINPAFRFDVLKSQISYFNHQAKILVNELLRITEKEPVDIHTALKTSALTAIFELLLEVKVNIEDQQKRFLEVFEVALNLFSYTARRFVRPWLYPKAAQLLFKDGRNHQKYYNKYINFSKIATEEMVHSFSKHKSVNGESKRVKHKSFPQILIETYMEDPSFTEEDLEGEVNNFITAGHDTVFQTMQWCLFLLALHPEVQEKAFDEVMSITEGSDADVSYSDLNELEYVDAVIKETLRLYPVVPIYGRKTSEEIACGKYKIPKNTSFFIFPYLLHRNPDVFPDPEKFDPERFYKNTLKNPWCYIPFAEGIRNCIGKNFALAEMKILLTHILRTLKISTIDTMEDSKIDWTVILMPKMPIRMKFTRRQPNILHED